MHSFARWLTVLAIVFLDHVSPPSTSFLLQWFYMWLICKRMHGVKGCGEYVGCLCNPPTHLQTQRSAYMHEARSHQIPPGFIFIFDEPVAALFRLSERAVNTLRYGGSRREGGILLDRWFWKGSFGLWKDTPNIAAGFPAVICQSYFFKCDRFISLPPSPQPPSL